MHPTIMICAAAGGTLFFASLYASLMQTKIPFHIYQGLVIAFSVCMFIRLMQCLRQGEDCSKLDKPAGYQGYKNSFIIYICLLIFGHINA